MTDTKIYIDALEVYKQFSDDPDTQTSAILLPEDNGHFIVGSNQIPPNVEKTTERTTRPHKYDFIGHAERQAICKAARYGMKTEGSSMLLNWFPCCDCAIAIVEAGIATLMCDWKAYYSRKDDPRYKFDKSMAIITEAGVKIEWFNI